MGELEEWPVHVRRPWAFAAVCAMVNALTLLVFGLSQVPVIQLLTGYVAAYMMIGLCIFGPAGKMPPLRQIMAFVLPGALLVPLALLDFGFWAGGWLLGLPAWGLLLSRWTPGNPLRVGQVLAFLGLLVLCLVIFTFNAIFVVFSLGLFLLPVIPLIRLAYAGYRARPMQAAMEILLAVAAVVVAFALPTPEGAYSSPWIHAGGAATAGLMIAVWAWRLPRSSRRLGLNDGAVL